MKCSNIVRLANETDHFTFGCPVARYEPFGIRARILNSECTDYRTTPEIILRDDGNNSDLGYTWPVLLDRNRVLVCYYFNKENGKRYIAGTILEIK